jgi:hypothetical protein
MNHKKIDAALAPEVRHTDRVAVKRVMRRFGTVLLVVIGLAAGPLAPTAMAGQGRPVVQERSSFDDPSMQDEFLSEVCGISVFVASSGKEIFKLYSDDSIVVHFNSLTTFYSPETGETLIRTDAANFRSTGSEVFDPLTETLTIMFDDTFIGLPAKWSKPGEGVLLRDAGSVRFQGTVVLDVSEEEPVFVSFEEMRTIHGPHPELETDVLSMICGALGA